MGDGFNVIPIPQGYGHLTAPCKELEKRVRSRKLRHGGNPVLRWMAANVVVEIDAQGNLKPSKLKSTGRIDGIAALVDALARIMIDIPEEPSLMGDSRLPDAVIEKPLQARRRCGCDHPLRPHRADVQNISDERVDFVRPPE